MSAPRRRWVLLGCLAVIAVAAAVAVMIATRSEHAPPLTIIQKPGRPGCVSETGSGGACARGRALRQPVEVAVSPDGRNVYVAAMSARSGGVAVFDRAATGALTQQRGRRGCLSDAGRLRRCAPAIALKAPVDLAIRPDGRNVYVAALTSDAIAILDRDVATGALTQPRGRRACVSTRPPCARVRTIDAPLAVAVSADGRRVHAYSNGYSGVVTFDRDRRDGGLTSRSSSGCLRAPIGFTCQGEFARFDKGEIVSGDGTNAYEASLEGLTIYDRYPDLEGAIEAKPGRVGCFTTDGDGCRRATGLDHAEDVALSRDGRSLYVVSGPSRALAIFDREPAEGLLTPAGCVSGSGADGCTPGRAFTEPLGSAYSVTVSPDGRNVYATTGAAVAIFDRDR